MDYLISQGGQGALQPAGRAVLGSARQPLRVVAHLRLQRVDVSDDLFGSNHVLGHVDQGRGAAERPGAASRLTPAEGHASTQTQTCTLTIRPSRTDRAAVHRPTPKPTLEDRGPTLGAAVLHLLLLGLLKLLQEFPQAAALEAQAVSCRRAHRDHVIGVFCTRQSLVDTPGCCTCTDAGSDLTEAQFILDSHPLHVQVSGQELQLPVPF